MHIQQLDDDGAKDVTTESDMGHPFTWPFMIQVRWQKQFFRISLAKLAKFHFELAPVGISIKVLLKLFFLSLCIYNSYVTCMEFVDIVGISFGHRMQCKIRHALHRQPKWYCHCYGQR